MWESLYPIELRSGEIKEITKIIKGPQGEERATIVSMQTSSRDFRYIEHSDFLVAYRPTYKNMRKGMLVEMLYAAFLGKNVLAYVPDEDPSISEEVTLRPEIFIYTDKEALFSAVKQQKRTVLPSVNC